MNAHARCDLYARIAELEAEVECLKAELGYRDKHLSALKIAFRLSPKATSILAMLYAANGRWVLRDAIDQSLINHTTAIRRYRAVDVHVCFIRKAIGYDSVESSLEKDRDTSAVRLTMAGMSKVRAAIVNGTARELGQ